MKVKPASQSGDVIMEINRNDESLLEASSKSPFQIKQILVPVDFSDCSKKALLYALPLARQNGATVTLLYVAPTPASTAGEYGGIDYAAIENDLVSAGETALATLAKNELAGKTPFATIVKIGAPTAEILDLAQSLPADLVVISTHGYSGLKHMLLGSVAEHVVRHAPCPVLVVREREHEFLAPQPGSNSIQKA